MMKVATIASILLLSGAFGLKNDTLYFEEPGGWSYDPDPTPSCEGTPDNKCGMLNWDQVKVPVAKNMCGGKSQSPINIETKSFFSSVIDSTISVVDTTINVINSTISVVDSIATNLDNLLETNGTLIDMLSTILRRKIQDMPSDDLVMDKNASCNGWNQYVNEHAFTVSFSEPGEEDEYKCDHITSMYKGVKYTLKNLHFHTPSEHTLNGKYYESEAHLVHKNAHGDILVMGIFLNVMTNTSSNLRGGADQLLNEFYDIAAELNHDSNHTHSDMDIIFDWDVNSFIGINPYTNFIGTNKRYYTYSGSLTTYPCTENVTWILFEEPSDITPKDLYTMKEAVAHFPDSIVDKNGANNRPLQSLNGRIISDHYASFNE